MLKELKESYMNKTRTENDAVAYSTTDSNLIDFFGQAGALRNRDEADIIALFDAAFDEDAERAFKLLFYFRDVRGGQGERRLFRVLMNYLVDSKPELVKKNLHLFPEYGRWDDLFCLVGTKLEEDVFVHLAAQLSADRDDSKPSLLAKWLPSENASSEETKALAKKFRKFLGVNSAKYRKMLSSLREKIGVVERKMSSNEWQEIDYSNVPSQASLIYKDAFERHDYMRYAKYLSKVKSGEATINADTLYPHQLVDKILYKMEDSKTVDVLWDNLPDYVNDNSNSIVVADVSGSMRGVPMCTSIGLAMYFAERNTGVYKDHFITFSRKPKLQKILGSTLTNKIRNLQNADWNMNTDIKAVFNVILEAAVKNEVSQEDMIDRIYIISDMEFDSASSHGNNKTVFETIRQEYSDAGYEMPLLVFWNVDARNKQFPEQHDIPGVQLVSGLSPSLFKYAVNNPDMSTSEMIDEILSSERYSLIEY